jgi:uncharacterized protein YprB with RNaseH-like and TPR domain
MLERSFILLSGVGEKTEQKLWRNGITRWSELFEANDTDLPGRVSRRRDQHESQLEMARQHLDDGYTSPFARWLPSNQAWRVLEEAGDHAMYLDIETTGLSYPQGRATVVGMHTEASGTRLLVRGKDLQAGRLQEEIDEAQCIVTFNGSRFDIPWLKQEFDVTTDVPHIDLMYAFRRLDITGGLKSIEKQLGLARDEDVDGMDGYEAVKLWRRYERGDQDALETLLTYNEEDVVNMLPLARIAYDKLKADVYDEHVDEAEASQTEIPVDDHA